MPRRHSAIKRPKQPVSLWGSSLSVILHNKGTKVVVSERKGEPQQQQTFVHFCCAVEAIVRLPCLDPSLWEHNQSNSSENLDLVYTQYTTRSRSSRNDTSLSTLVELTAHSCQLSLITVDMTTVNAPTIHHSHFSTWCSSMLSTTTQLCHLARQPLHCYLSRLRCDEMVSC